MTRVVIVGASAGGLSVAAAWSVGVLAAGASPKILRAWRARIAARTPWTAALDDSMAA